MTRQFFDKFWHQRLKRPYILARPIDEGRGEPIVLLHGIGRTAQVWQNIVPDLSQRGFRVVAMDLLGFGKSAKPDWADYSIDEHAAAVIATIERMRLKKPLIIVGHSMGCLVAVRVAKTRPDLIKHLVLYEMPLYEGLPHRRSYLLRTNLYFKFYERVMAMKPTFDESAQLVERLSRRIAGQELTPETWQPFLRSLKNTIMAQTTGSDIKQLKIPMDVIYGRFDMFVIGGHVRNVFGVDNNQITSYKIGTRHVISPRASHFLLERILVAAEQNV